MGRRLENVTADTKGELCLNICDSGVKVFKSGFSQGLEDKEEQV